MRLERWLAWLACIIAVFAQEETENEESRKVLGSSVVTSVSVIMDHGNGTKTYLSDDQSLDQGDGAVGSPIDLLNPDRYEFYTFDETGDLVKRLMTLDQIKGLLATGDGETLDGPSSAPTFYHESLSSSHLDDSDLEPNMAQGVHSVVASVQNVLKSELEATKTKGAPGRPPLTIPDSISSWSMLFPAIISDAEALDDGTSSGNSVNEPIGTGDRLTASSNEEKVEVRIPQEPTTLKAQESTTVTDKPTAVPPIIHFLEIHSVPAKETTKTPVKLVASASPGMASTSKLPTTTDNPTSTVSLMQEMSASISSLLSQVTDDQTVDNLKSDDKSKLSTNAIPLPTEQSFIQLEKIVNEKIPQISNVDEVTKQPLDNQSESATMSRNKVTTQNIATTSTTTEGNMKISSDEKVIDKNGESFDTIKKSTDKVVSFVTTSKPTGTIIIKPKPTNLVGNKQKLQSTTPSVPAPIKSSNTKTTTTSPKKPSKPAGIVSNGSGNIETLEAHSSDEILKIVPNKQSPNVNKVKNNNQTKLNLSSSKPLSKPLKKVPSKPPTTESPDCTNSKNTPPPSEQKVNEKLEVAASTNLNNKVQATKLKPSDMQEIKIIQRPTVSPSIRPVVNKIKPSDDVKITTYKPSTIHPFTTKQSIHKISTTTTRPLSENKISSASKIHEVNSSLLDIKKHVVSIESNKTQNQILNKVSTMTSGQNSGLGTQIEGDASHIDETKVNIPNKVEELSSSHNNKNTTTDIIDHASEVECTHSKKPVHSSIQDKISDTAHEIAASNAEVVKLTTVPNVPTTIVTTDSSRDVTTEIVPESSTKLLQEDLITTTELLRETATDLPETTTLNMPDVDFVKEGISAVTNILLDLSPPLEPQLPIPTLPLSESASNLVLSPPVKGEVKHAAQSASVEALEMTTADTTEENITGESPTSEKELLVYFTTTELPGPETEPPTTEVTDSKNGSSDSVEDKTERITNIDTTPITEELTTTEEIDKKQSSESKIVNTTIKQSPTKESKLGPENVDESPDNGISCNETLAQTNKTNSPNAPEDENADNLEPAQSIMLEINKINAVTKTPSTTTPVETTPKSATKNEKPNSDFKTAVKPDSTKFTQVKYPAGSNAYRPLPETANPPAVELHPAPHESMGLEATTAFLADDVRRFSDLCNELAFRMWTSITGKGSISSRSLVLSPFATTSLLAMVFLGARGPTSGQMNDVLRLDDMVTFNPHQVLQNVTESVLNSRNYGVTTAAFVRELYSDKLKGKILDFYKERAQQYYDGHVEEISFNLVGDILRRRTNLLVKRQTLGKVPEYLRGGSLSLRPPLAAFSANIFQTDCDLASTEGRDGEMYFVVRPSTRQRRLVPVPAAVWRTGFLAGYEPGLDATAVALGTDSVVSTVLVLPGQQGQVAPGDGLARLEQRLIETSYRRGGWTRLLRSLLPRPGLELQVPRFSHRSVLNITSTLQRMGLKDLFNENKADLRGLNGLSNDLHLSDMVQVNTFSTCGEDTIGARHHIETYPVSPQRMGRDDPEFYPRPEDFEDPELFKIPLNLRPRQARLPDSPRLRFDRPFLYMVRHNPTGMILHMGRFNPRLLP